MSKSVKLLLSAVSSKGTPFDSYSFINSAIVVEAIQSQGGKGYDVAATAIIKAYEEIGEPLTEMLLGTVSEDTCWLFMNCEVEVVDE